MDIIIVGGRIEDERRIQQLGASTGIELRFRHAPRVYSGSAGDEESGRGRSRGRAPRAHVGRGARSGPELGLRAPAAIRGDEVLEHPPARRRITARGGAADPAGGFDDFVIAPFADEELVCAVGRLRVAQGRATK